MLKVTAGLMLPTTITGSLPAQTWHDIMVAAHQGVEIKEIAGIGAGTKLPTPVASATVAANGAPKPAEIRPPPILTKRGADILVRVEKMLDEAAQTAGNTPPADPVKPASLPFPDSFAAAAPGDPATSAPRKN